MRFTLPTICVITIETCGVRVTSCSDRTSINARTNDNKTISVSASWTWIERKLLSPDNWGSGH